MKEYAVTEIFPTIQGEGYHAGRSAVFLRLARCNMWTGRDADRMRDASRTSSKCPEWCDTDFALRRYMTAEQIVDEICAVAKGTRFIVISGGEPCIQLDEHLVRTLLSPGFELAVETNGSIWMPQQLRRLLWVTCSPKQPPSSIRLDGADELKVVFPAYEPLGYAAVVKANHHYVQPQAATVSLGKSHVDDVNTLAAARWVMAHPGWKLSIQTHKVIGIP